MLLPNSTFVNLVILSFTSYAVTFVIASSSLFGYARRSIIEYTPWLKMNQRDKHFIECRMCVGFWCSVLVCGTDWGMVLPVYGLSYFIATQER